MKDAWRIGRIAGIDVFVHFTFLILVAWVGIGHYLPIRSWTDAWNEAPLSDPQSVGLSYPVTAV